MKHKYICDPFYKPETRQVVVTMTVVSTTIILQMKKLSPSGSK